MKGHTWLGLTPVLLIAALVAAADRTETSKESLQLSVGQKDHLWLEPILVTVRLDSGRLTGLPALPGKNSSGTLRFEIEPEVKLRKGAKALPLEALGADLDAQKRDYDLFESFLFPDKGGTFKVRAVLEHKDGKLTSEAVTISLGKPAKGDPEVPAMERIHHTPWSNYDTNAFCGDTFDLVKRWPSSRYAKYCHYWNGRYSQNKKEYDKAIASYRIVVEKHPDFALADDADYGIIECLVAQKKLEEAKKHSAALSQKLNDRSKKSGIKLPAGQTVVQRLAGGTLERINRDLGQSK